MSKSFRHPILSSSRSAVAINWCPAGRLGTSPDSVDSAEPTFKLSIIFSYRRGHFFPRRKIEPFLCSLIGSLPKYGLMFFHLHRVFENFNSNFFDWKRKWKLSNNWLGTGYVTLCFLCKNPQKERTKRRSWLTYNNRVRYFQSKQARPLSKFEQRIGYQK